MSTHETAPSPWIDLIIWGVLVALICGNFGLAHLDLGNWGVWVALLPAFVATVLILTFYMELRTQHGSRRFVLPAGFGFFLLLVGLTLLDVASRYYPATPRWAESVVPREQRPAVTRTAPPNLTGQTKRMPARQRTDERHPATHTPARPVKHGPRNP